MTEAIVIGAICSFVMIIWLIFVSRANSMSSQTQNEIRRVVLDFEAKKKSEKERIDNESRADILDDLNKR